MIILQNSFITKSTNFLEKMLLPRATVKLRSNKPSLMKNNDCSVVISNAKLYYYKVYVSHLPRWINIAYSFD